MKKRDRKILDECVAKTQDRLLLQELTRAANKTATPVNLSSDNVLAAMGL